MRREGWGNQTQRAMQPSDEHATAGPSAYRLARPFYALIALLLLAVQGCAVDQEKEVAIYRSVLDADVPDVTYAPGDPRSLLSAL